MPLKHTHARRHDADSSLDRNVRGPGQASQWPESHLPRSLSRYPGVHVIVTPMATLPPALHRNYPAPCMIDGRSEGYGLARKIQGAIRMTAS
jgi:hypothetical protein